MKLAEIFKVIVLTILLGCLQISCSTVTPKNEIVNSDSSATEQDMEAYPKVDFKISITDTILKFGDNILLNISLTNNSNKEQKLLFDKPALSTGGPWETTGNVTDIYKKISVLKHVNKAMLSSQIYAEDELKNNYYYLKPGQTISGEFELKDIVVFKSSDNSLPKGTYEVQLFYHFNPSNMLTIKIK